MSNFKSNTPIPALTVRQPWAMLIARGVKRFETRGWPPPKKLIGQRLTIHAGQARLPQDLSAEETAAIEVGLGVAVAEWTELPVGALICSGILAGAYRIGFGTGPGHLRCLTIAETLSGSVAIDKIELEGAEERFGDLSVGRWAWSLRDIQLINPPTPARGQRRIWRWCRPE